MAKHVTDVNAWDNGQGESNACVPMYFIPEPSVTDSRLRAHMNAKISTVSTELGIVICRNFSQCANASMPIFLMLPESMTSSNSLHNAKAPAAIESNDVVEICTLFNSEPVKANSPIWRNDEPDNSSEDSLLPINARLPIDVSDCGISMLLRSQQKNAESAIDWIVWGIVLFLQPKSKRLVEVSISALQFSRESYTGLSGSICIDSRLLHCIATRCPIFVVVLGMCNSLIFEDANA